VPKSQRKTEREPESATGEDVERFVASLIPTYLSVDTQGRVIRMDSLSKVRQSPSAFAYPRSFVEGPTPPFSFYFYRRSHRACGSVGSHAARSSPTG
jgi:hypothetical protein